MKKTSLLACFLLPIFCIAQYTKLYDFSGQPDGSRPECGLVSDGTYLYGTTTAGGTSTSCPNSGPGCGTIFKIKKDGSGYLKLFDFMGINGSTPDGSLYYDGSFLYGTTVDGGANHNGTIYRIKTDGTQYSMLHDFTGPDGAQPLSGLISDGTFLYGSTLNPGVIYKIKPDGTEFSVVLDFSTIHQPGPIASLLLLNGSFYGMTNGGGMPGETCVSGCGTIFKVQLDGSGYTTLLVFSNKITGSNPYGSLISDGTFLYGMTTYGGASTGCNAGCGTIFRINPDGSGYTRLLDFSDTINGSNPFGSLISDGTFLYGMTALGGLHARGTIFKIKPDGTDYEKLYDFSGVDGNFPTDNLVMDGTSLYGVTLNGGANDLGAIFKYQSAPSSVAENKRVEPGIYPNPSAGRFIVSADAGSVLTVWNLAGEKIVSRKVLSKDEMDLSDKPEGIYFAEIVSGDKKVNRKLILSR
jgi:uncharacterized repeat protein (TIGR03803 family)